jgi:hypothetical protein
MPVLKRESTVRIIGPRKAWRPDAIDVTSRSTSWSRLLSPFLLGPCKLYGGFTSRTMENAWQYSKVYPDFAGPDGKPSPRYFTWAQAGWAAPRASRYPMGKGAAPLYSWRDGEELDYLQARERIYLPLYRDAAAGTPAFAALREKYEKDGSITLWDYDGYDRADLSLYEVLRNPAQKMGHAFVLAMMLVYGEKFEIVDLTRVG